MVYWVTAFCGGAGAGLSLPGLWPAATHWLVAAGALLVFRRGPLLAAFCLGFAWTGASAARAIAADWPCERDREMAEVKGRVAGPASVRHGRTDFDLAVAVAPRADGAPLRVRVSWYEPTAIPLPGERWRMTLRLRCRNGMANPGGPDRELDLLRQGIGATGYVVASSPPKRLDRGAGNTVIERVRARIASGIDARLPGNASGAVLQGLAVGVRGNIPDLLWEAFAATGVAHLMAISGLHVTGCAMFVLVILRGVWRFPGIRAGSHRPGIEGATVVAATAAYAALSGASLPALRTLAMVAIVVYLRVLRRSLPLPKLLAGAAFVLVACDPLALTSAGFWLSFAATAALLSLLDSGPGWLARTAAFARAQLAIFALLAPVLAITFGRVSLVAPLANAAAIPLFTFVVLPGVLFGTMLEVLAPGSGAGIWRLLAAGLDTIWPALVALAGWPHASWSPAAQPAILQGMAGAATLVALCLPFRGIRIAAVVLLLSVQCGAGRTPSAGAWTFTVLDVGQGLAAVVATQGHVLVFDTGPRWRSGGDAARVSLLPFLRARGVRRIDRLIVSHADQDHAGGAETLADAMPIASTMAGAGMARSGERECRRGDRWRWDGVDFEFVHPPAVAGGSDNDRSCALRIAGAGGSALLLADPEADAESTMQTLPLAADVVLLPHHGSRTSSSPDFVAAVSAQLGIASAGYGNRWDMPSAEIVARWRSAGTTVLTTAEAGAVTVRFAERPGAPSVETERGRNRHWWRRGAAG